MAEKRHQARMKKRLKLTYGVQQASQVAFTEDFNDAGLFIKTTSVLSPRTKLLVVLFLPDNEPVCFEALVMWSRRVPGSLIHLAKKGGMGVRITSFISNEEKYRTFCRSLAERSSRPPAPPRQTH